MSDSVIKRSKVFEQQRSQYGVGRLKSTICQKSSRVPGLRNTPKSNLNRRSFISYEIKKSKIKDHFEEMVPQESTSREIQNTMKQGV
jgi:hypothetical protein